MATPPVYADGEILYASSMNAIGMWLVKTQSVGSNVTSVTVNSAFSANYDNYLILYSGGTGSASGSIGIQLGASATSYYGFLAYGDSSSNTILGAGRSNQTQMNWIGGHIAGQASYATVQIMNPFKAAYTRFANGVYQSANAYGTMQGEHRVATSYSGFTLLPENGTISLGSIYVYGYRF